MDCLVTNETFAHLLIQHGSLILFVLLVIGIIVLPIPEETLLVFSGMLMAQGILNIPSTIFAAVAGSLAGISISYLFGLTGGNYLMLKYGRWIGITAQRLENAREWFNRFGKWSLFIGYFIPGVRHFTGFTAGTAKVEYHHFALFAYTGGIVWVSTFLSIGYFFGDTCLSFFHEINLEILGIAATLLLSFLGFYIWKKWVKKRNGFSKDPK